MIEKPSRAEWAQITESVVDRVRGTISASGAALPAVGTKFTEAALAKFKAGSARSTQDLAYSLILFDLAGCADVLLDGSRALRAIPFTGDYTLYDPVQQVTCCAYRRSVKTTDDGGEFEPYLSFTEHDGAPGPLVIGGPERNRLSADQPNTADQIAWNGSKPNTNAIANTLSGVAELGFLWAFGGSDRWPVEAVDREITASTDLLRAMGVIPSAG